MYGSYIGILDLVHDVQHWSFAVTLCVLILADQALRTVGREPMPPRFIQRLSDGFLVTSGLWGAYFVASTVLFLHKFWKGLLNDAGPILVFVTLVALAAGLWLACVGVSRAVTHFGRKKDDTPRSAQANRAAWITMFLTAAWFVCCCLVFSAMYAYVYLSTLGLLLLGFYGTSEAGRSLLKGPKQDTHVLVRIVGALSASLGLFAFIGVFYRFSFGESWAIVIRQFLVAVSFGGIGVLLLCRRWRVVQLVLSIMAIFVVVWRVSDCVYKVPKLSSRMDRLVRSARTSGCGRYDKMLYYGSPSDYALLRKSIDLAEVHQGIERATPNCDSIPMEIQVTRGGVAVGDDIISLDGDLTSEKHLIYKEALKWGVSQGLILVVDRVVPWKDVVILVEIARQNGNSQLFFLLQNLRDHPPEPLPDHRLAPKVEEILAREQRFGAGFIYCARTASRISAFCPQVQMELSSSCYGDWFEKFELFAHDLPWAAAGCFGDIDLEALEMVTRCFFRFDSLYVIKVPVVGPDAPWSQTVSLPADMPWSLAYKHLLQATSEAREPIPPLRLLVGEPNGDGTEK